MNDGARRKLRPCPESPNCVSSQSRDPKRHIDPLRYESSQTHAIERLLSMLEKMKRVHIVSVEPDYIHAEFRSRLFRFVDDVEFLFDETQKTIHIRSAS